MDTKKKRKRKQSKIPQKSISAKRQWLLEKLIAKDCSSDELKDSWKDENGYGIGCDKTLTRWIQGVETDFDVNIEKRKKGGDIIYSLSDDSKEHINKSGVIKWLIDIPKINASIQKHQNIKNKILMDVIPSAEKYLDPILEAISYKKEVELTYKKYSGEGESEKYIFHPYCVKLFENRWYVIGLCPKKKTAEDDGIRKFSLDVIQEFTIHKDNKCNPIHFDEDFDAKAYFDKYYGIYTGVEEKEPMDIKLKVDVERAKYIRELPLHHSQKEVNESSTFSIFTYHLIPAADFYQALLHHGPHVEVLAPESARNKMKELIREMAKMYKND
jgi:hypothetical protein